MDLGHYYYKIGDSQKALDLFDEAINCFHFVSPDRAMLYLSSIYITYATILVSKKAYDGAIAFLKFAEGYFKNTEIHKTKLANIYLSLATAYKLSNDDISANLYANKALEIYEMFLPKDDAHIVECRKIA